MIATGNTLDFLVTDTTRIWYQASNFVPLANTFGLSLSSPGSGFAAAVPRGVVFNVNEYLRLNSVRMEVNNGPFTADIESRDNQNTLLYTIPVAFPSAGKHLSLIHI